MVGIIDYIRQHSWDKHVETWVKSAGLLPGGNKQEPTVISPKQYMKRFRAAMEQYFTVVPFASKVPDESVAASARSSSEASYVASVAHVAQRTALTCAAGAVLPLARAWHSSAYLLAWFQQKQLHWMQGVPLLSHECLQRCTSTQEHDKFCTSSMHVGMQLYNYSSIYQLEYIAMIMCKLGQNS